MLDAHIELTEDEKILLEDVPKDGRAIGNGSLRNILKWDSSKYVEVKKSLIQKNILQSGRGRGGSVSRDATVTSQVAPNITHYTGRWKEERKRSLPLLQKSLRNMGSGSGLERLGY